MGLSFMRGPYDVPGPWASVSMDATHDTESSRSAIKIRWKDIVVAPGGADLGEGVGAVLCYVDQPHTGPEHPKEGRKDR